MLSRPWPGLRRRTISEYSVLNIVHTCRVREPVRIDDLPAWEQRAFAWGFIFDAIKAAVNPVQQGNQYVCTDLGYAVGSFHALTRLCALGSNGLLHAKHLYHLQDNVQAYIALANKQEQPAGW